MTFLWMALALVSTAEAASTEDPAVLYEKGAVDYKLGRFDDALASFQRSYELSHEPALLFNIGQCHRQLKHHERAVFFFQGYLTDAEDVPNRDEVTALIAEEQALVEAERAAAQPAPAAAARPAPRVPEEDPLASPVVWGVGIGAAALLITSGVVAAVLLWQSPAGPSGSLGSVDLREAAQ